MATTPGLVTSNVAGSTWHPVDPQVQARQWELEDRTYREKKEADEKQYATDMANWEKNEAEGKMRAAYEKFYGPMIQSQWDLQQGQVSGVSPGSGLVSGDPRAGAVYKKGGRNYVQSGAGIGYGQSPYEYRPDTDMPADEYTQSLNDAYEMWKAGQLMGASDWKQYGLVPGKTSGGAMKFGQGE